MSELRIGIVGYATQDFEREKAREVLRKAYNTIDKLFSHAVKTVVSGLTDQGIAPLAYAEAKERNWETTGIGIGLPPKKIREQLALDEEIYAADAGEEQRQFFRGIDVLICIGTDAHAQKCVAQAKERRIRVWEYPLNNSREEEQNKKS